MDPTSQAIPILSLIVAALAVFFGPFITLFIGRKQIELSRRIANKQIVAPMRQAWINDFRYKLAELSGSALHYLNAGFDERKDEEYKRLIQLEEEIALLINPGESDHQELVISIRRMILALQSGIDKVDDFIEAYQATRSLGQKIFKTEWNRVKDEIEKP
jgi:hypothetical protein